MTPLEYADRLLKHQPANLRQSEQEVVNYNRVLSELNQKLADPFTAELLHQFQAVIMVELLPEHHRGLWRQEAVGVYDPRTREVVYILPNYEDVPGLMSSLITFVQADRGVLDPLLLAGLFHKLCDFRGYGTKQSVELRDTFYQ